MVSSNTFSVKQNKEDIKTFANEENSINFKNIKGSEILKI